ncbi:MAG: hypothetical protein ACRDRO_09250 [Pseudonocardiaceae bacterium]
MTDYVLAAGTNKAPAARAPEHMAAWLEAHGYWIVGTAGVGLVDPRDPDVVERTGRTMSDYGLNRQVQHLVFGIQSAAVETHNTGSHNGRSVGRVRRCDLQR